MFVARLPQCNELQIENLRPKLHEEVLPESDPNPDLIPIYNPELNGNPASYWEQEITRTQESQNRSRGAEFDRAKRK